MDSNFIRLYITHNEFRDLSIPLNGFYDSALLDSCMLAWYTFNSIEWILEFGACSREEIKRSLLSIPLNGFPLLKLQTLHPLESISPFNSIEWIPARRQLQAVKLGLPFNSIEWIHNNRHPPGGVPGRGCFQFHWMDSSHHWQGSERVLRHFQFHWMDSPILGWGVLRWRILKLSIPLNGFRGWGLMWCHTMITLSIPLNGFRGSAWVYHRSSCKQ